MNLNVISQLLTVFMVVSGPAVVAYLAYKKHYKIVNTNSLVFL
jgi:hypothetical protein